MTLPCAINSTATRPAMAFSILPDIGVFLRELVALATVRGQRLRMANEPPFSLRIQHVVSLRSDRQVVRAHARRDIARMEQTHPRRYRSDRQLIGHTVGSHADGSATAMQGEQPIASLVVLSSPKPAGRRFVDLQPEPQGGISDGFSHAGKLAVCVAEYQCSTSEDGVSSDGTGVFEHPISASGKVFVRLPLHS